MGKVTPAEIDRALGILAGLVARHDLTAALPAFAALEAEGRAREDTGALLERARARAYSQKS